MFSPEPLNPSPRNVLAQALQDALASADDDALFDLADAVRLYMEHRQGRPHKSKLARDVLDVIGKAVKVANDHADQAHQAAIERAAQ